MYYNMVYSVHVLYLTLMYSYFSVVIGLQY